MNVFCWLGWNEHSSVGPSASVDLDAVAEPRARAHAEVAARRLVPERAEADDDAPRRAASSSRRRNGAAVVALVRCRRVRRRRALHRRRHPGAGEAQPVVDRHRRRLVGESGPMHRAEQPVAAAVAREDPAGAVGAVGGGRQPEHDDPGGGIAEAGHRPAPVVVVAERGALRRAPPPRATRRGAGRRGSRPPHQRSRPDSCA